MISEDIQSLFPFAFPRGEQEEPELEEPIQYPEFENLGFSELYLLIFKEIRIGEKLIDMLKRKKDSNENLDEIVKYVSELYCRSETDIFSKDWLELAISSGKIGEVLSYKWDVKTSEGINGPLSSSEIAPKKRILAAMDAEVRINGTEEWCDINKIRFEDLEL